jgi:hypothetical protein
MVSEWPSLTFQIRAKKLNLRLLIQRCKVRVSIDCGHRKPEVSHRKSMPTRSGGYIDRSTGSYGIEMPKDPR